MCVCVLAFVFIYILFCVRTREYMQRVNHKIQSSDRRPGNSICTWKSFDPPSLLVVVVAAVAVAVLLQTDKTTAAVVVPPGGSARVWRAPLTVTLINTRFIHVAARAYECTAKYDPVFCNAFSPTPPPIL